MPLPLPHRLNFRSAAVAVGLLSLLSACATSAPPLDALQPPVALKLDGVPPVTRQLAQQVGRYVDFRSVALRDWHPDGASLLVAFRSGNTTQLHRAAPGAPLQPLTQSAEPTRSGRHMPADGNLIVFERDAGGSEAKQIYRLDVASGRETQLTEPGMRHDLGPLTRDGRRVAYTSVPLDRTAAGGTRAQIETDISVLDPAAGTRRLIARLPGPGWYPVDFTTDGRRLLVGRYKSAADSELWRIDVASGARTQLLPRPGDATAVYSGAGFAPDDERVFIATDAFGEFRQLYRFDPRNGRFDGVTAAIPWDIAYGVALSDDRRKLAVIINEAGRGRVSVFDATTLRPIAQPAISGSATGIEFSRDARHLAVSHNGADSPGAVSVVMLADSTISVWARPDTAGIDTAAFREAEVIDWPSFDGRRISGLITRPPARFSGKRPVLIDVHGGPAVQATIGFNGRYNYLIHELGVVLIEPNVRGSTGFGKSFVALDDGYRREDSVKDLGSLLDWIAQQPDLDAARVVVSGGSYGGYMALAAAVHYSDRIRGAIDIVGISHFVSFLERTESYRRDLRRIEYGDERDPAMRAFLDRISPLTNANRIRAPLFVLHGRNDPRVPVQEAEQIVAILRRNGVPVWSLIADNEGHGFGKKENADYAFYARVLFLERLFFR